MFQRETFKIFSASTRWVQVYVLSLNNDMFRLISDVGHATLKDLYAQVDIFAVAEATALTVHPDVASSLCKYTFLMENKTTVLQSLTKFCIIAREFPSASYVDLFNAVCATSLAELAKKAETTSKTTKGTPTSEMESVYGYSYSHCPGHAATVSAKPTATAPAFPILRDCDSAKPKTTATATEVDTDLEKEQQRFRAFYRGTGSLDVWKNPPTGDVEHRRSCGNLFPSTVAESITLLSDNNAQSTNMSPCVVFVWFCNVTNTSIFDVCSAASIDAAAATATATTTTNTCSNLLKRAIAKCMKLATTMTFAFHLTDTSPEIKDEETIEEKEQETKQETIEEKEKEQETKQERAKAKSVANVLDVKDAYTRMSSELPENGGFSLEKTFVFDNHLEDMVIPWLSVLNKQTFESHKEFTNMLAALTEKVDSASAEFETKCLINKLLHVDFEFTGCDEDRVSENVFQNAYKRMMNTVSEAGDSRRRRMTPWEINHHLASMGVHKRKVNNSNDNDNDNCMEWMYCGLKLSASAAAANAAMASRLKEIEREQQQLQQQQQQTRFHPCTFSTRQNAFVSECRTMPIVSDSELKIETVTEKEKETETETVTEKENELYYEPTVVPDNALVSEFGIFYTDEPVVPDPDLVRCYKGGMPIFDCTSST